MLNRLDLEAASSPHDHGALAALEAPRGGTSLTLPNGEIVGELRPISLDPGHSATYELAVANGTSMPLATFAYAALRPNGQRVFWSSAMVPPESSISIPIEIPIRTRTWPERVIAELHTGSAHLTIDAGPPPNRTRGPALVQIAAICLTTLLVVLGAIGYLYERPQVVALAAPDAVEGGKPFSIAYALTGASNARYSIDATNGKQVAQGILAAKDGSFSIALPGDASARGYDVHVIARNALGTDSRAAHIVALPVDHQGGDVKITASLQHAKVNSGDQVVVNYRTSASDGSIDLVDQQGTVHAETLLNPGGSSILIAPTVDREQDYRIVVRATLGNSTREKRLSLRIEPGAPAPAVALGSALVPAIDGIPPPVVPAPAPTVLPTGPASSMTVAQGAFAQSPQGSNAQIINIPPQAGTPLHDTFALTSKVVKSGATFPIKILHDEREMHVALMDMTGDEITGVDVAAGQKTISLTAPHVPKPDKYLVVATFTDGYGQETVVRPVTIGTH
jgi:hypothetical protein